MTPNQNLTAKIDASRLQLIGGVSSRQTLRITTMLASDLPAMMAEFKIDTTLRIAHFLAQLAHESDHFKTLEEYASGAAYEGRADLGNTVKGDGARFKGRGPIQITGRANYRRFTAWMRSFHPGAPNFENDPELVEQSPWAACAAVWYWHTRNLNALADRDDLRAITKSINGGYNGLSQRANCLARAKRVLASFDGERIAIAQDGASVFVRGDSGQQVADLQEHLKALGYYHLAIDGDFGAGTEGAVRHFQSDAGLAVDGIVGRRTLQALVKKSGA